MKFKKQSKPVETAAPADAVPPSSPIAEVPPSRPVQTILGQPVKRHVHSWEKS